MWDAESKRKAIFEIAEKYHIDLSSSYAYGDTNGDFAMLKARRQSLRNQSNQGVACKYPEGQSAQQ